MLKKMFYKINDKKRRIREFIEEIFCYFYPNASKNELKRTKL
jgi:hypothetical protein